MKDFRKSKFFSTFGSQLVLLLSAAFWGSSFIFTKGLFETEQPYISTIIIVSLRLLIATLTFFPFLIITKKLEPIRKGDWLMMMLLSFWEPYLYMILETSGVSYVSGSLASIIIATIPLCVPFGMAVVFKEKLNPMAIVGVLLSLVGIVVMMINEEGGGLHVEANPIGILFLVGAVFVAVVYTVVLVKVLGRYKPYTITAYQNLFGLIYFIPIVLVFERESLPMLSWSWEMWGRLAFLGVFCSTVSYVCFNIGIKSVGATAASVYNNLIPVFTLILAVAIGQESLTLTKVVGMAIVMLGLFLAQIKKKTAQ